MRLPRTPAFQRRRRDGGPVTTSTHDVHRPCTPGAEDGGETPAVSTVSAISVSQTDVSAIPRETVFDINALTVQYGSAVAVKDVSLGIHRNAITALIGPSGCGKSTVLRCLNRMNDLVASARVSGQVLYNGVDLYGRDVDPIEVRRRIGMVFQRPNPF